MRPADGPTRPDAGLGIAIVNYRNAHDTAELVRSLAAANHSAANHGAPNHSAIAPVAVAVVDNSDQMAELEAVVRFAREQGMHAQLIHGHGNVGYAAGNNLAAAWLLREGADVLWVLNPDTRLTDGAVTAVLEIRRHGERAIGATPVAGTGRSPHPGFGVLDLWTGQSGQFSPGAAGGSRKLTYVAGHSLVITRRAWEDLGGLSDDFFLFYEEADLAVRCNRLGIPLTALPTPTVAHPGGATTGATTDLTRKSTLTYFHASRSCIIFFRKHYRRRLPIAVTARLAYAAKVFLRGSAGAAGAVLGGLAAGLRA
jgi:N-acetylglucosaminyl-diphospho-decaprenol L-rhamnosyltransferase